MTDTATEIRDTYKVHDDIEVPDDLNPAEIELVGIDGNAGAIMGAVARALRNADNPKWMVDLFYAQAMSGDYDHLLRVAMVYNGDM
jgi:hypothetical protein